MVVNAAYHFSLPPGTAIEEYRIISVLGQGSFGVTYLAEDINLGARLAIKEYLPGDWAFRDTTQTVRPKNSAVSESFERGQEAFLKEARLLAQVTHPNIVKVRRFFRAHGTAYIAMDFIDGRSLGDTLNEDYRSGGYPSAALRRLLVSVLDGLAALHAVRIIHRDIKPGNVVIEPSGNPMLVDFGAARNFDPAVAQGMTVIVTPGYAPIEQYSDDGEQGPFTDIYALGALAYRAITGQPPDAPYKRLGANASTPASVAGAGKYPPAMLAAIDWALAVQPQDRPQSASVLLARLREAPDDLPGALVEPTQILGEATQILESSRWRSASTGKEGSAVAEPSLRRVTLEPSRARNRPASDEPAPREETAVAGGRRRKLVPLLAVALAAVIVVGAAAYFVAPRNHVAATAASDQDAAAAKLKSDQQAAEAVRAEAARQAAAKAEADRQAAAAAQQRADQGAAEAARQEAERQAAANAAAARAEADRQATAAATLKADQDAAAEAARQKATRETAAKAEAQRAAAAVPPKKLKVSPVDTETTSQSGTTRCSAILQTAQLMGEISDDDKNYLREHCH
jgi:serine/threonine protein kinase